MRSGDDDGDIDKPRRREREREGGKKGAGDD